MVRKDNSVLEVDSFCLVTKQTTNATTIPTSSNPFRDRNSSLLVESLLFVLHAQKTDSGILKRKSFKTTTDGVHNANSVCESDSFSVPNQTTNAEQNHYVPKPLETEIYFPGADICQNIRTPYSSEKVKPNSQSRGLRYKEIYTNKLYDTRVVH